MLNLSIKWKLSFAFIALSLGLVGIYIFIATQTFESDKVSYVFDSEQVQVENISQQINRRFELVLIISRAILPEFDLSTQKLNHLGANLFENQKDLLAVEIWNHSAGSSLLKIEKTPGVLPTSDRKIASDMRQIDIQSLDSGHFLFTLFSKSLDSQVLSFRIVADLKDILPQFPNGSLILSQGTSVIAQAGTEMPKEILNEVLSDLSSDRAEKTMLKEYDKNKYLISHGNLKYGDFALTAIMSEQKALSALHILFNKSLIFLGFSVFATILISLFLSSGLTHRLQVLTGVSERLGKGDFSNPVQFNSKDEVGVLSQAFGKMSGEIQRLLSETKDKARMESELKTASLVQESLFPSEKNYKTENIELSGLLVTPTECGGDWWHYFKRGDDLFVMIADATGHGTPAALITSAARSLFSQIEVSDVTLSQMASQWDRAIACCSNQKILMTAFMMQIHLPTGQVRCLNASHELPYLLSLDGKMGPIFAPNNPRLGMSHKGAWEEYEFHLKPGDKVVLYTDGLLGVENPEGKIFGETKLVRLVEKQFKPETNSLSLAEQIYTALDKHRQGANLPDDVTLVVIGKVA